MQISQPLLTGSLRSLEPTVLVFNLSSMQNLLVLLFRVSVLPIASAGVKISVELSCWPPQGTLKEGGIIKVFPIKGSFQETNVMHTEVFILLHC